MRIIVAVYTPLMKRTQFYLEEGLDSRLREAAEREGRSAAALVRDALEHYLASKEPDDDPLRPLIGAFEGKHRDAAMNHDKYLYRLDK
jgi:plasmid stability protein